MIHARYELMSTAALHTRTVQPYAYGTENHTVRVCMVRTIRVRYVPYAYGMKYANGIQQTQAISQKY